MKLDLLGIDPLSVAVKNLVADVSHPLDMEKMKAHLAVDGDALDSLIEDIYIPAAVNWAEGYMKRVIMARNIAYVLRDFPQDCGGLSRGRQEFRLPKGRTVRVEDIEYKDGNGTHKMYGPSGGSPGEDFQEDLSGDLGGILMPSRGQSWPVVDTSELSPVVVSYVAGWETAAEVPAEIKHALMVAVTDMLELRGTSDMQQLISVLTSGMTLQYRETLLSDYVIRKP